MGKRLLLNLMILFIPLSVFADDESMDSLLTTKSQKKCFDYYITANELLPELYWDDEIDSMVQIINYIDEKCHLSSQFVKLKILLDKKYRVFQDYSSESRIDSIIYSEIARDTYYPGVYFSSFPFSIYSWETEYEYPRINHIDSLIFALADEAVINTENTDPYHLACLIFEYDYESFYITLQSEDFENTEYRKAYQNQIREIKDKYDEPGIHAELGVGGWSMIDRKSRDIIGDHLELSALIGFKTNAWLFDLSLALRVLNTKNLYTFENNNGIDSTNSFFGGYGGIDIGHDLFHTSRFESDIFTGIGIDGFGPSTTDYEDANSMETFCLNGGVRFRIFLNDYQTKYLGLTFKYSFIDYYESMYPDLPGNSISLLLTFGGYEKNTYKHKLQNKYYLK